MPMSPGMLLETRLQVTILRTVKNEEIVVPNSMILNNHVINYSAEARERGLILHTSVTIGYDTPWRQVHAMLLMAARKTPGLLAEPAPFVLQKSLDDFYVTYELNVYTDNPQKMTDFYSELHRTFWTSSTNTACRSCRRTTSSTGPSPRSCRKNAGMRRPLNHRGKYSV